MKIKDSAKLRELSPIIFIFLLTVIFFFPVIFQGKTFYAFDTLLQYLPWSSYTPPDFKAHNSLITDPVNVFYPYYSFLKECSDAGTFFFWKSYNFCGLQISPTGHLPAFFSYLLFPQSTAHDLLLWLHLFGAGLFMFLYLKNICLNSIPALIGAIAWMFNGYVMVWFEFENVIIMAPSLPASLYYSELWLKKREKLHCLCFTCAIALSVTNGSAQLNIYQLIFIGFYFAFRYFSLRKNSDFQKIGKKELPMLGLSVLLLVLICSSFLIRHLSLLDDPHRRNFSFEELYDKTGKLPEKYLTTLIFPDFFGTPAGNNICFAPRTSETQSYNNYNELCIYSGILPLFLVFVCLPYLGKKEYILFYFFTAVVALTMAMGSVLYYPMAKFIPGLNLSSPTRILYIFGFSMTVLAAIGADILLSGENIKKLAIITLWSLLLGAAITISLFVQTETGIKWASSSARWGNLNPYYRMFQEHFALLSPVILKPLGLAFISFLSLASALLYREKKSKTIFLSLALLIISYDLMSFGLFYNTVSPRELEFPETEAVRFLKKDKSAYRIITYGNFMHNSLAPFRIQDAGGYSSFYPKRYGEFLHLSQNGTDIPFPDDFSRWIYFKKFGSPLLDLINIKYLLLPPSMPIKSLKLKLVYDGEIKIYENTEAFPRAFFVPSYQLCESRTEAYQTMASYSASDFRKKVVLESLPPKDFIQKSNTESEAESTVKLISYRSDKIEIDISAAQKGFLVISDNYHSEWRAEIDKEQATVLRANYIMRAIPIEQGVHKVLLTFSPRLLISGVVATAVGWFAIIVLIAISAFAMRKKIHSSQL